VEPRHREGIVNLGECLGTPVQRKPEAMLLKDAYPMDKYIPLVSDVVQQAVEGKLDPKAFEFTPHSGRYQNIVLFIVGGISFMELRWCDIARSKLKGPKLYVGSTTYLLPRAFLAQASQFK
jgi:hypothetical protein